MDDTPSPARDVPARGSRRADQLIMLIMSGKKPVVAEAAQPETNTVPAPTTQAKNGAFWSAPPDSSTAPQPRVEATFVRGAAQYQTPAVAPRTQPAATPPRVDVPVVAPSTPPPVAQLLPAAPTHVVSPQPEIARIPGVEPVGRRRRERHRLHVTPTREHDDYTPSQVAEPIAPPPEVTQLAPSATPIADVDEVVPIAPSPLDAAIAPYLREQPESAMQEFTDRAEARRAWRQS